MEEKNEDNYFGLKSCDKTLEKLLLILLIVIFTILLFKYLGVIDI